MFNQKEKGKEITGVWAGIRPLAYVHGGLWPDYRNKPHQPPAGHPAQKAGRTRLVGRAWARCPLGADTTTVAGTVAELTMTHRPTWCYG
jgi:hypothetical protein